MVTLSAAAGRYSGAISRRHLNSWFAFTSWRRATIETDAPGSNVSATISRFNASGHCRFGLSPFRLVSTNSRERTLPLLSLPCPNHRARRRSAAGAPHRALTAYKLLIIDELGYVPLSTTGAELLFEVFSQRYERAYTIVTSNLPFDEWTSVFGAERLTGALLDRLTHHVHILEMNGDSYRLKQSKQRQRRT